MSNFRKTSEHSVVNTLRKMLTFLGCLFFLFSVICPFYYARWIPVLEPLGGASWSTHYWSYKVDEHRVGAFSQSQSQFWFSDYWFSDDSFVFDIQWVLVPMFAIQLLTLVIGVGSVFFNRRNLLFAPVVLSSLVAVLMTYANGKISGDALAISAGYQMGYYLVYPSLAMFLMAFLLNEVTRRRQTTNRESLVCTATEDKVEVRK